MQVTRAAGSSGQAVIAASSMVKGYSMEPPAAGADDPQAVPIWRVVKSDGAPLR
jgi:hypothetical protein